MIPEQKHNIFDSIFALFFDNVGNHQKSFVNLWKSLDNLLFRKLHLTPRSLWLFVRNLWKTSNDLPFSLQGQGRKKSRSDCPGQVKFALGQVKMEVWWSGGPGGGGGGTVFLGN